MNISAEQYADSVSPRGCECGNNGGGDCDWCQAKWDWEINDAEWRAEATEPQCPECFHPVKSHDQKYGCEVERGDGYPNGSEILQALGPCSCTATARAA